MCACMMECVKTESRSSAQADMELMEAFLLRLSGLRGMGISTCLKCVFWKNKLQNLYWLATAYVFSAIW